MKDQLKDKIVIVTGASSGIGRATAIMMSKRGASITLCGRNMEELSVTKVKCEEERSDKSAKFITVQGDVCDRKIRKKILDDTIKTFGRIDVIIVNAGTTSHLDQFENITPEAFDMTMNTNFKSSFFLMQSAIPHLEKSKGCVVAVSSVVSTVPNPSVMVYSVSKAALDHLTRLLASDMGSKGIRFNTVRPGFMITKILRNFENMGLPLETINQVGSDRGGAHTPLYGRLGYIDEAARAIVFLASDEAHFITGEDIKVDGAATLKSGFS